MFTRDLAKRVALILSLPPHPCWICIKSV